MRKVAIVGIGATDFKSTSTDVSYREMIYEAAVKAYQDAGVEPKDIQSFVCCAEDFMEGNSITDEYAPDQLGAVLKPVQTIPADGIWGLATAYMQIAAGLLNVAVVEAHSKASNIVYPEEILAFAFDPIYNRIGENPHFIAGMEMNYFLSKSGNTKQQCAQVVVKNKRNALLNPQAGYAAHLQVEDVLNSETTFYPLSRLDMAPSADGAVVLVLAAEEVTKSLKIQPVWIKGLGWVSDTPVIESRNLDECFYTRASAQKAYKIAGIKNPKKEIDLAEVDDSYSYKELQHLEAMMLAREGEAGKLLEEGEFYPEGSLPVNLSGGSQGCGFLFEASGLQKVYEVCVQLRGEAGKRQIKNAKCGLAQSWRGVPTASGAVVILERE